MVIGDVRSFSTLCVWRKFPDELHVRKNVILGFQSIDLEWVFGKLSTFAHGEQQS